MIAPLVQIARDRCTHARFQSVTHENHVSHGCTWLCGTHALLCCIWRLDIQYMQVKALCRPVMLHSASCHAADVGQVLHWPALPPCSITSGTFGDGKYFQDLVDNVNDMTKGNDWFLVANDFATYMKAQDEVDAVSRGGALAGAQCRVHALAGS